MELYVNEDMAQQLFLYLNNIQVGLYTLAVVLTSLLLYLVIHNSWKRR